MLKFLNRFMKLKSRIPNEVDQIKGMIRHMDVPPVRAFFADYMLLAEKNGKEFYKAGIFVCDEGNAQKYRDMAEFWVWSSVVFIENTLLGREFYPDVETSLQWREIPAHEFSDACLSLIRGYKPDELFQQKIASGESIELETVDVREAFLVLDTEKFKSMVARTEDGYVSLFDVNDKVGEQDSG